MRLSLRFFFSFFFFFEARFSIFVVVVAFQQVSCRKSFFFLPKLSLKIGFTALFTHLKIVLL